MSPKSDQLLDELRTLSDDIVGHDNLRTGDAQQLLAVLRQACITLDALRSDLDERAA